MKRIITLMTLCALMTPAWQLAAQNQSEQTPRLFEYPVAPDTCSTLESRCNYLIAHFWDNYDITKPIKDDVAFAQAFIDYVEFFKFGHKNVVMAGIRDFMYKARSNASNLEKIGRVAEYALYGPMASFWSDEVYVEFTKSITSATNLPKDVRNYYMKQMGRINQCQVGHPLNLEYHDAATGSKRKLSDLKAESFIVFFGGKSADTSIGITRLSTDVILNDLINQGKLKIVYVFVSKPEQGWDSNLPDEWENGYSEEALETVDLRALPACYLLDKDYNIVHKNVTVDILKESL